jgi:phenylacetate-CoA ligase
MNKNVGFQKQKLEADGYAQKTYGGAIRNDNMTVEVELEELFTEDFRRLQELTNRIQRTLKDEILLTPHVKLLPKGALPVSEGKAVRVVDKRKVYQ